MNGAYFEELPENYKAEISEIRVNEPINSLQFIAQIALLFVSSIAGWLVLNLWQMPVWFVVYYTLLASEKYLIFRIPNTLSRFSYSMILGVLMLNASVFCFMPVFLWFQGDDLLKLGTLALVTGYILNCFLTRARYASILACYLIPNSIVFLIISYGVYLDSGWSGEFLVSVVAAGAIATYFTIGLLEAHLKEWKAAATQTQLQQTQRMEVIGRLTGGVSHDFNNLLSVISGSLQLLREAEDEHERNRLIQQALIASEHGSDLTRQLLASGKQAPLSPTSVDTIEMIENLRPLLAQLLPASIEISTAVPLDTSNIRVDPGMLQSAFINLVLNASAAMPNGGTFTIEALNAPYAGRSRQSFWENQKFVEISVTDTGVGIAAKDLDGIFEPFFTTRDVGKGSGLGLPMVKGFVEQSNGHLELSSIVGEGTRVSLFFPASANAAKSEPPKHRMRITHAQTAQILVVDDNQQLLDLLVLKLRRDGHTVWTAESGDEALAMLKSGQTPDLLLTDVIMSGDVQGPGLIRYAKRHNPNMPVIVMSGYAATGTTTNAGIDEADFFFEKPLQLGELSTEISRLLSARKSDTDQENK